MAREFVSYIATTKVSVGVKSNRNEEQLTIDAEDIIEFDGQSARIGGVDYMVPRLKSAIKARWLVPVEEIDPDFTYTAPSALISMSAATPEQNAVVATGAITSDEERDVGTLASVRRRGRYEADLEEQGGTAVQGVSFNNRASGGADDVSKVSSTNEDALNSQIARKKAEHLERLEELKSEARLEETRKRLKAVREAAVVVGITEIDDLNDLADFELETAVSDILLGEDEESGEDVGDLEGDREARLRMAQLMIPGFTWDFDMHWRKKLNVLKDGNSPLQICTVYGVESDKMKKQIAKAFPNYISN
jgi:hypothetical protein